MTKESGIPFFNVKSVWDLDIAQTIFLHWVMVYTSVYELPNSDRPSEEVINDDERFDEWFERYTRGQIKPKAGAEDFYEHRASRRVTG